MKVGGAQRLLADLLPILNGQVECTLLVFKAINSEFSRVVETKGIKIEILNSNLLSPFCVFKLRSFFKDYDIIHVHLFPTLYWAALASMCMSCKLVYTEHSTSNKRRNKWYFKPLEKWIYKRYDRVIAISEPTKIALECWLGKSFHNKVIVCQNGIDLEKYKKKFNKGHHVDYTLMMVSRFVPAKDQDTVIRSLTKIPSNISVTFVGDGIRLDICKKLVEDLNLKDRVTFLGSRPDIPELLSQADIGIQSSNWEGFGLTAVEFMAAGKPVIASEVDGLKQVVEGAGLLFKKGDETDLAAMIVRLYSDKSFYDEIVEKCSNRSKVYDIHLTAEAYLSIYYSL